MSCKNCSIQRGLKKVRSFLGSRSQWERGNGPRWPCSFGSSESLRVKVLDKFCQWSKQSNFQSCQKEQRGMHRGCSQSVLLWCWSFRLCAREASALPLDPSGAPSTSYTQCMPRLSPGGPQGRGRKCPVSLTTSSPCPGPPASHPQEQNGLDPSLSSGSPDSW